MAKKGENHALVCDDDDDDNDIESKPANRKKTISREKVWGNKFN